MASLPAMSLPKKSLLTYIADIELHHNYAEKQPEPIDEDGAVEGNDDAPMVQPEDDMANPDVIIADDEFTGMEFEIVQDEALTKENYQEQLESKDREIDLLKRQVFILQQKQQSVERVFEPDQILRLHNPSSRMPWSDLTLQKSMQIYYSCGAKGYKFLREKNLPLPEKYTIVIHCNTIEYTLSTQN